MALSNINMRIKNVTRLFFIKTFCKTKICFLPYSGEHEKDLQRLMSAALNNVYSALHLTYTLGNIK